MEFVSVFTKLCNEINKAPTTVCTELGLSNSTYSIWRRGAVPRNATISKIARYFNVSEEYLLGETDDRSLTDSHSAEKTQNAGNLLSGVEFALYGELRGLSEDQQLDILDYVRFKKQQWEKRG